MVRRWYGDYTAWHKVVLWGLYVILVGAVPSAASARPPFGMPALTLSCPPILWHARPIRIPARPLPHRLSGLQRAWLLRHIPPRPPCQCRL